MKKNIIFISIIIIVVSMISIFIITRKHKDKLKYELEVVTNIDYMLFSENNKFGVINKNGEIIIPSIYDEIQIPNPSKPLFICMYDYNEQKQQYNIKVLNEKSEQILYQYVVVEAIKINSATSNIPYEKSVLKYKENGKYGLIDFNGSIVLKAKYDEINGLDYNEGLLLVKKNEKYGVININGAIVVKEKYDIIQSDGYYEEENDYKKSGFIVGKRTDSGYRYGYINCYGKKVLDNKYNQIERIQNINKTDDIYLVTFENGRAGFYKNNKNVIKHDYEDIGYDINNNCLILQKDSKQGIADFEGNIIIDIQYDNIFISGKYINAQKGDNVEIYDYTTKQKMNLENVIGVNQILNSNYIIAITRDEKYKIYDNLNNEFKGKEYDYLEYLYDDYFIASNNGKYGIIDKNDTKIQDFKYDVIRKIGDTKIVQASIIKENKTDLLVLDKKILSIKNAEIYIKDDYIIIQSDSEKKYISFTGDILENTKIFERELYSFKQGKKWGFVNKNNEIIVQPKYDFVTEFNEYGFAGIKKDEKWGCINIKGEVIIEPTYTFNLNNPNFVGKYYEYDLGYGEPFFTCENIKN